MACVVGTWSFSKAAVKRASEVLQQGLASIDAVERGINCIEDDETYGPCVVGRGGARNRMGHLELDAAIMEGNELGFGAVTALRGVSRAVSVARRVMEKSEHNMLTGEGALEFAKQEGFNVEPALLARLQNTSVDQAAGGHGAGHDTLGLIAVDSKHNICAGVSTSGKSGKYPGRVGDSALPGCGLYADNKIGGACCTGDGDEILKYCPCFHAVQLMKQGLSPQESCDTVLREIINRSGQIFEFGIIAVNTQGDAGSCSTVNEFRDPITKEVYSGFPVTLWKEGSDEVTINTSKTIKTV